MISNDNYVHLHCHTEFSRFDGLAKIDELTLTAKLMGFPALAITDHGNVGGWIKFFQSAKKKKYKIESLTDRSLLVNCPVKYKISKDSKGRETEIEVDAPLKPILGEEFYLARDHELIGKEGNPDGRKGNRHILLLAKNEEGYKNLCTLSQRSWTHGQYIDPRVDLNLLAEHSKGIICSSACFFEGQWVNSEKGLCKIEELSLKNNVVSGNGEYRQIKHLTSRMFSGNRYTITSYGHCGVLDCTEDHEIFVFDKYNKNLKWIRADKLDVNSHFLTTIPIKGMKSNQDLWEPIAEPPTKSRNEHDIRKKITITPELAYLVGLFLAEGSTNKCNNTVTWTFCSDEIHLAFDVKRLVQTFFDCECSVIIRDEQHRIDVSLTNYFVSQFFVTYCGKRADGKYIHNIFLTADRESKEQILRGLAIGDGSYELRDGRNPRMTYATVSRHLLMGFRDLCLSLGIRITTASGRSRVDRNGDRHKKSYYVYAYSDDAFWFESLMFKKVDYSLLNKSTVRMNRNGFRIVNEQVVFISKIKSILKRKVYDRVFCLSEPETLAFHADGLCVHNCLGSVINNNLLHGRYDQARKAATLLKDIYGEDFYMSTMFHGIEDEGAIIPDQMKLSRELGVLLVAENDCHFCRKEQALSQELVMAMSTSKCLKDPKRIHFPYPEFYLKSAAEMGKIYGHYPEILTNTLKISERISEVVKGSTMRLPTFDIGKARETAIVLKELDHERGKKFLDDILNQNFSSVREVDGSNATFESAFSFMLELAEKGMKKFNWHTSPEHVEALKKELLDVRVAWESNRMDFATYFLIVWDYINFARSEGILTGCGRGSGYASVLLRTLGITYGPCPIKYGLIWERFLGFDEKFYISDHDWGFGEAEEITVTNDLIDTNDYDIFLERAVEDDQGGVDRY